MFKMLGNLTKAVVGVAVELPVAVVADVVTLGGSLTDTQKRPYTTDAVSNIVKNVKDAAR